MNLTDEQLVSALPEKDYVREARNSFRIVLMVVLVGLLWGSVVGAALWVQTTRGTNAVTTQKKTVDRTECIRPITTAINDARWDDVFDLLAAAASKNVARERADIGAGLALRGATDTRINAECPLPISHSTKTTTTTVDK